MKHFALIAALLLPAPLAAQEPVTPSSVVAAAAPQEWVAIAPDDLLVMDLAPDAQGRARRVVIQLLPPPFSQPWVDNIRTLARAHWWDGTSVYRVVDNWVTQWGAGEDGTAAGFVPRPLPERVVAPVADYTSPMDDSISPNFIGDLILDAPELSRLELDLRNDAYAHGTFFHEGWPLAADRGSVWPIHCYAHVGVARDLDPDTGTGAELYAVIGHAPRQLDRNIAVVGRVIAGIEHLSTLPRGTGEAGVYASRAEDTPILSVRLASELPEAPAYEYLSTGSDSFARYVTVRANRSDAFYAVPAGGVDICNVQVPVREIGG